MSDFLRLTDIYLSFYDDLNKRRNELDSYSYILQKINSNSYQESAMIRSGIVIINSHYEGCIKKVFELYLNFIYDSENKLFKDIFYYDSLDKINKGRIVNNIKISKLRELMIGLGLSYDDFILKIKDDILEKKLFLDEVIKSGFRNKFYEYNINGNINIENTLNKIINKHLILERNSVGHGDLVEVDKKLFYILKLFVILFLNTFIGFIIDNISNKNYLK